MKSFGGGFFAAIFALALVIGGATASGSVLVPPQGPIAPDLWTSCTGCVTVGSGIFGTGSTSSDLGFVYSAGIFTNDPLNPYGLNDLDFIYSFLNNATSTASISRIAATNIEGAADAGYFTAAVFPGGTIGPTTVDRISSDVVGFNFNSFGPGDESFVLVIKTNAMASSVGLLSGMLNVIDSNGNSTSVPAFAPVPEPALFWPLAGSLIAVGAHRRMRVAKAQRNEGRRQ